MKKGKLKFAYMTKLILSAQGVFKAGLRLFFYFNTSNVD